MGPTGIIIITATAFLFFIVGLAALVIFSAQRKRHLAEVSLHQVEMDRHREIAINTLRSQESERRRIGMDLHDELGPTFSVVKMNMARIRQQLGKGQDPSSVMKLASETSDNLNTAIEKFSDLSKLLYPVILSRYGLNKAIEDAIERSFHHSEIQVHTDLNEIQPDNELMSLSIYRMLQEMMHNTVKHADADNVWMSMKEQNHAIHITYRDDGKGFDKSDPRAGIGLESLNGRVEAIGGHINFETRPGQGVNVAIRVPHHE